MIDKVLPGQPVIPGGAGQVQGPREANRATRPSTEVNPAGNAGVSFRELLDDTLRTHSGLKFSAHAVRRLSSRGIELGPADVNAVEQAVDRAAAKGARDSLVLGGEYALVVNVPSRTVVTAFDQAGLAENVVTNIDSAVFLAR